MRAALRGAALAAFAAAASALPGPALPVPLQPAGAYRDEDPAARANQRLVSGATPEAVEAKLLRAIEREPERVALRVELGYVRSLRGETRGSDAAYDDALALAGDSVALRRHVLWSWGWSLFNRDDARGALTAWQESARLHGGAPFWVPYSYAVALWTLGERDAAIRWYDAAVRSAPGAWGTRGAASRQTVHWKPKERAALNAVYAAWEQSAR